MAARGLEGAPLDLWGLVVLTPSRVVFQHFPQPHPLFGGTGKEVSWEIARHRFAACDVRRQGFWEKLFSGTPDHVALTGTDVFLALEAADGPSALATAWSAP